VKVARASIYRKTRSLPELVFEDQQLSSFGGLLVFEELFRSLGLWRRVRSCCSHLREKCSFSMGIVVQTLIVHLLLGYRKLQEVSLYADDPLVLRVLEAKSLPGVSTLSRALNEADSRMVETLRGLLRSLVLERVKELRLRRVTLDFDGSVQSTRRHAEGAAVGYNRKRKGARSYYPLFCMLSELGMVFDVLFRPGNVHDSNGALEFSVDSILQVRKLLPGVRIEVRMDGAFFQEELVEWLTGLGVEFTISVPFHRLSHLKSIVEQRKRWKRLAEGVEGFELKWKPARWRYRYRFVFIRQEVCVQQKGPIQLDLFEPYDVNYEFKVLVTNKSGALRKVLAYHEGRGNQESVLGELKTHAALDYVPVASWSGNQVYALCGLLAHNMSRELQIRTDRPVRRRSEKRSPLWCFEQLGTLRRKWIQRAARITRPQGYLTVTMSANAELEKRLRGFLHALAS
jgi:hypothetical protein